jgi:hypothetical protein
MAGIAQDKPKSGLGKIIGKADTLIKKVTEKPEVNRETIPTSEKNGSRPTLNVPKEGFAKLEKGQSLTITGFTEKSETSIELIAYKTNNNPNEIKKLAAQSKALVSMRPMEILDYQAASKKNSTLPKQFKTEIISNNNQKAKGVNITTTLKDGDLEAGSYYLVFKSGAGESNPLPLMVFGNCDINLDIINIKDSCAGLEGSMAIHKICFDITYKGTTCPLQYLTSGNGLKVWKSDYSSNYTITGVLPALTSQPASGAQTIKSYCITVLVPATETNVILSVQGDACFTTPVVCQPGAFESVPLKFCTCNFCETVQWDIKKGETNISQDRRGNWFVTINDNINIPGQTIKSFKAEITGFNHKAANKNEDCLTCNTNSNTFGNLTAGTLTTNGWGTLNGVLTPIFDANGASNGNGHHTLNWFIANGATTTMGGNIRLNISIPPFSTINCCDDEVAFCVRYTFTTADCKTCSKVVCYTGIKRVHK